MDLAIMNVAVHICVHIFVGTYIFISYGKWSIIARSFDKYWIFPKVARWSLKVTVHFTFPPAVYEGSYLSKSLSRIVILLLCFSFITSGSEGLWEMAQILLLFYLYYRVCDLCVGVTRLGGNIALSSPFGIKRSALSTLKRAPGIFLIF